MTLSEQRLRERLTPRPVKYFSQIASTQDVASEWLRSGVAQGAVVVADEQIGGRGRQGRGWHTPPGEAIAMSVVLRPPLDALPQITMLGALAILEAVEGLGADDVDIKWPNDVLLGGKKVCGVLPEAAWDGDTLRGVVLGMGVNVRVDFSGTALADKATSIETVLNRHVDRVDLVVDLLGRIDALAAQWGTVTLFERWQSRLVTLGQQVTVGDVHGTAESVEASGALMIRTDDGALIRVVAGDLV